eukprot:SAG11_NODE_613_length_8205_cov_28.925487_10_plen_115_part_00
MAFTEEAERRNAFDGRKIRPPQRSAASHRIAERSRSSVELLTCEGRRTRLQQPRFAPEMSGANVAAPSFRLLSLRPRAPPPEKEVMLRITMPLRPGGSGSSVPSKPSKPRRQGH